MREFWWVNHSQTHSQEILGGYLWSPKVEKNSARSQFYDNMREAKPGDVVVSFADAKISYIGTIVEHAFSAPKPTEFGNIGLNWSHEGWLLPVEWQQTSIVIRPKSFIEKLAPLLPLKYSPINAASGNGNQKAYLARISKNIFEILFPVLDQTVIRVSPARNLVQSTESFIEIIDGEIVKTIESSTDLSETEKNQLIKSRKGQGLFRSNVFSNESHCRLTGVTNPSLLIASHIKPWRSCQSGSERLDGHNGLLLTPHADLLFDRGFLTFENNGRPVFSDKLLRSDIELLRFPEVPPLATKRFTERQRAYLEFHRANVFLS